MSRIIAPFAWQGLAVEGTCRNWTVDADSNPKRMGSDAQVLESLVDGLNHQAARRSRPIFQQALTLEESNVHCNDSYDPLFKWLFPDTTPHNTMSFYYHIGTYWRPDGGSNANYWFDQWDSSDIHDATCNTHSFPPTYNDNASNEQWEHSMFWSMTADRNIKNTVCNDGVSNYNQARAFSINVYEIPKTYLDDDDDDIVANPYNLRKGEKILHDTAEEVRDKLHQLRIHGLPIIASYCAPSPGTWEPAAPGNVAGFTISNEVYVNLFDDDRNIVTRDANTPGIVSHATNCGYGLSSNVPITFRVLANATCNTNIMLWGPKDNTIIEIEGGSGLDWYGTDAENIQLDAGIAENFIANGDLSKIDVHGEVVNALEPAYLYGLMAWVLADV